MTNISVPLSGSGKPDEIAVLFVLSGMHGRTCKAIRDLDPTPRDHTTTDLRVRSDICL